MHTIALLIAGLVIVGVIALVAWYFSPDQRALRAMQQVPRRRIDEVIEGEKARVVGQVEVDRTIAAPLSGRACAYWRVVVRERRSAGKSRYWTTIIDEHEGIDFFLRDGGAKALIKTQLVQPVLEKDGQFSSGFLNDATPELAAFLASRGHSSEGWVFNKNIRYHEGVVEPGERVCVVGVGRWERDPDEAARAGEAYRDAQMLRRLVMHSPEDGPLLLSDETEMTR